MYPADDMTMKELKIACYAAKNILDRLENGQPIQRWQISAIVKAKEELASVYTSLSADEDEWEDDYEEEPMYVGFEYPRMYGEEVELDEATDADRFISAIKTHKNYKTTKSNSVGNVIYHMKDGKKVYMGKSGPNMTAIVKTTDGNRHPHTSVNSLKRHLDEEVELDEAVEIGDYSVKKTKEKKPTSAHPDGKAIHHILHKGVVVGTIEPYSAYREKRKPGSRIVQSRTDVTHYQIHFGDGKGPRKSADIPMYHKMKHSNIQSALQSAATVHSEWMKKNEEVELDEETKYVVKGKSPFYKQDHYLDTTTASNRGAHLIKKHIKHATRMRKDEAEKHAKDWESHPNKYKTEVVAVNEEVELNESEIDKNELKAAIEAGKKKGVISSVAAVKHIRSKYNLPFTQAHNLWKNVSRDLDEEVELDEAFKVGDKVTYQKSKRERGNAVISSASTAKKNHFYLKTEKEGTIMVPAGELELAEAADTHKTKDGRTAKKGLWYNINQRRKKGLPPKKPGDEGYPETLKIEETSFSEGYNDPVHRDYISSAVHEYVPKDDPRHNKIVDHLHKAKNYGTKTKDELETAAGISTGTAQRVTKAVADHMKANFGSAPKAKGSSQAQRIDRYLKQKWVK